MPLRDNPKKITPLDLERGKQVFLCVDQTELTAMNGAVKLILDQMLYAMQRRMRGRTESEVPPLLFIIDELPQLLTNGPLEQLIQGLRVLRSSKVRMILAFQTIESLETAYSHSQVVDLCSNCNHMIILNGGNSTATLEMVCSLAGQFSEKRQSVSSGSHGSTTTSFEEKNILTPAEINRLPQQGKALILSPSGYMIVEKSPYYQCKYIQPMAADIERHNRQIQEVEGETSMDAQEMSLQELANLQERRRAKMVEKRAAVLARKARTHKLIVIGGTLASLLPSLMEQDDDEIRRQVTGLFFNL